jgi:hypothetical protein
MDIFGTAAPEALCGSPVPSEKGRRVPFQAQASDWHWGGETAWDERRATGHEGSRVLSGARPVSISAFADRLASARSPIWRGRLCHRVHVRYADDA